MDHALHVKGLRKEYRMGTGVLEVLKGVDLRVERGEVVCVMGPSGSGKSTLLNLLGGLDRPSGGSVEVDGSELSTLDEEGMAEYRRRSVGFVFQSFNLIAAMTAQENVALPLVFAGFPPERREARASELLARVGLAERADHKPTELSGGEQQRVAIARAIVNAPSLLLADEPTGNLDTTTGAQILALLREMNEDDGVTLLLTTHDPDVASTADRVVRMRDGEIESDGR